MLGSDGRASSNEYVRKTMFGDTETYLFYSCFDSGMNIAGKSERVFVLLWLRTINPREINIIAGN